MTQFSSEFDVGFIEATKWLTDGRRNPEEELNQYRGHLKEIEARKLHDEEMKVLLERLGM